MRIQAAQDAVARPHVETHDVAAETVDQATEDVAGADEDLAGLGVTQTSAFLARSAVDRGELIPLLARFQPPAYPFHLAYPPRLYVSNRLRVFIDWAAELFGRLA